MIASTDALLLNHFFHLYLLCWFNLGWCALIISVSPIFPLPCILHQLLPSLLLFLLLVIFFLIVLATARLLFLKISLLYMLHSFASDFLDTWMTILIFLLFLHSSVWIVNHLSWLSYDICLLFLNATLCRLEKLCSSLVLFCIRDYFLLLGFFALEFYWYFKYLLYSFYPYSVPELCQFRWITWKVKLKISFSA